MSENQIKFKVPAGMKDILPEEAFLWQEIEEKTRKIFACYGYKPITTPILEESRLFSRSLGGETEIVRKQMFTLSHGSQEYSLRPEATAAVVRAYLENNLDKKDSFVKLYYAGPMFRAERPQKGRFRQFHHIGVEAIGSGSPYLDAEVISLADRILGGLQISGYNIKVNSLGCPGDRQKLGRILLEELKGRLENFCDDCKERYSRNVFRVLDCKNDGCKEFIAGINLRYQDYLCGECLSHFEKVRAGLDRLKVNYSLSHTLVRGLDYYSRTVFEISHRELGAQDALGAGGRYDGLISELGGGHLGAIGFALGVERLLLVSGLRSQVCGQKIKLFMVTLGEEAKKQGFVLLNELRKHGISCDMDYEDKSLKGQLRRANDLGAGFTAIIGDDEIKKGIIALKDMKAGLQTEIRLDNFVEEIKKMTKEPRPEAGD